MPKEKNEKKDNAETIERNRRESVEREIDSKKPEEDELRAMAVNRLLGSMKL